MPRRIELPRLTDLPSSARLAIGCFCCLILGFVLLAQVNLWHNVGDGAPPSPEQVLAKYRGDPDHTPLESVLDPALPLSSRRNMWQYLSDQGAQDPAIGERRAKILKWVESGAPESQWTELAPIFTAPEYCGACHVTGGERSDLPFETYAQVLTVAAKGRLKPLPPLLITAHNHLFGFSVLALLLSLLLCMTRVRERLRAALILAASAGAALDVASWFLTRAFGRPFHWFIMLGGGLFGTATSLMALLVLWELIRPGQAASRATPAPQGDAPAADA